MPEPFKDRTNVWMAGIVFIFSFIVYYLTVQPTLSYWDCGEFIACSYILGIPHPPGSPLFIVIGRIFSILPFASDICYRINMISVISSAAAVMFAYLTLVRMIRIWFNRNMDGWNRIIAYIGGVAGSLMMAFGATYWANAVEAEVYGLSSMLMAMILWLTIKYLDVRETAEGSKIVILVSFLAMLGIGIHLSTFLILPISAIFFIIKKNAPAKVWYAICGFLIAELLAILLFSTSGGGYEAFIFTSVLLLLGLAFVIYKHINIPLLIAIGGFSMIMVGFWKFVIGVFVAIAILLCFAAWAKHTDWKTGIAVLLIAVMGFSFHLFIPIRSAQSPRIDENNASRSFTTFVNYLERKQYGSTSMTERMFKRRGLLEHQFGRHAHMGFWSYFEKQYGLSSIFLILFLLGLFGAGYASWRKYEIGLPFLTLLLLASVGLILYMNFADGCRFDPRTGDAYLEVRNRDYFFTPAYAFFGMAIGLGIAGLMDLARRLLKEENSRKMALSGLSLLVFLPAFSLAANWHQSDRSDNYYPKTYSENILDTCEENAILFTSGDNDTFPLWCIQEVYNYRKDVRVVNLSLLNTDWYVWQMKNQYDVPMSLERDQIEWHEFESGDRVIKRPLKPFIDHARKKRRYLIPMFDPDEGRTVKVQDMMVDEIVIANKNKYPVYFSSEPYVESPLKLRDKTLSMGVLYKLVDSADAKRKIDSEAGFELYMNKYNFTDLNNPNIFRDENATGVMLGIGFNGIRIADAMYRSGDTAQAIEFNHYIIDKYPEFYMAYTNLAQYYRGIGDTARGDSALNSFEPIILELIEHDPESQFYLSDYGLFLYDTGRTPEALEYLSRAFEINKNSGYVFRKYAQVLYEKSRISELQAATFQHAEYGANLNDQMLQSLINTFQRGRPDQPPLTIPGQP